MGKPGPVLVQQNPLVIKSEGGDNETEAAQELDAPRNLPVASVLNNPAKGDADSPDVIIEAQVDDDNEEVERGQESSGEAKDLQQLSLGAGEKESFLRRLPLTQEALVPGGGCRLWGKRPPLAKRICETQPDLLPIERSSDAAVLAPESDFLTLDDISASATTGIICPRGMLQKQLLKTSLRP
ncbi:UNVERIFIED_CONTAM: hypothetical protein K2H54_063143 [Gekko kuhli]